MANNEVTYHFTQGDNKISDNYLLNLKIILMKGIVILSFISLPFSVISMSYIISTREEKHHNFGEECLAAVSQQQISQNSARSMKVNPYEILHEKNFDPPGHREYESNTDSQLLRPNPYEENSWHRGAVVDSESDRSFGRLVSPVPGKPLPKEPFRQFSFNETKNYPIPKEYYAAKKIVHPHPFKRILNEATICTEQRKDIFILAVIHTSPGNFKRRMVIRETWGSQMYYDELKTAVLFATGMPHGAGSKQTEFSLIRESNQFHDIIQEDFHDSYKNLTYKGVMWLKWVSEYCPKAKFVLKVDDDIFVNVFNLVKHLKTLMNRSVLPPKTLLCLTWYNLKVLRSQKSKWYVSPEEYSIDYFPPYCSGSAYIVPQQLIQPMFNVSKYVKFFWVDDTYITGLLIRNIPDASFKNIASLYVLRSDMLYAELVEGYSVFGHMPKEMVRRYDYWRKILEFQGKKPDFRMESVLILK